MNKILRTASSVYRYWLPGSLAGLLMSCAIDDLTRRDFPKCTAPSAQIGSAARLLDVNFKLEATAGTIDAVIWSFGDGSQTSTANMTTRHVFTTPGTYNVSAKLTNKCGDEVTVNKEVIVDNTVPPTVTTLGFLNPNVTTVTLRMVLDNNGNGKISRYGICYSDREGEPTIVNSLTVGVAGDLAAGSPVSFTVGQLTAGTVYYFRGFATNNADTGYGSVGSVITSSPPSVTTVGSSMIGTTTASVTFIPINAGSPPATRYGVCYSATSNTPTVGAAGSFAVDIDAPTIGASTILTLTNLMPNTTYSYRAYAISAAGISYSFNTLIFKTQTDIDLTSGLIASYEFDGHGLDASGNNNNGTLMNDAGFGPDRKGRAGAALQLDGINDYFDVPDAVSLRPTTISVSVWIKPATLVRVMQIYNKSNFADGSGEQYSSLIRPPTNGGNNITINVDVKKESGCNSGKGWQTASFSSTLPLNTWHHLVAVFEGSTGRLYFDGALLSEQPVLPGPIDGCVGGSLKFGAQSKGIENYFHGSIDDIRMYNRALTVAQIQALANQ
ncbi:MAG: PKD domain-containing protein [Bacteroidetes bacterium]|nr:PKD domain-containing protein [Fibrella sp.]